MSVFPDAYFGLFSTIYEFSKSILLSVLPVSNILSAVGPDLGSIALTFIVKELSFILNAVRLNKFSVASFHAVDPIAFIDVAIWFLKGAKSVNLILKKLTLV